MGLFDFLSGSDEAEAARAQNQMQLAMYGLQNQNLYNQYQSNALGALGTGRTSALDALSTGLGQQVGAYQTGVGQLEQGLGASRQGLEGSLAAGRAGVAAYDPLTSLASSYAPAVNTYYSSLGIGDPSLARNAFSTSPGYQFQQDEAARQLTNMASRFGNAASGNTLQALGERAQNIANTQYGNWQDRLAGFVNPQLQATSAAAQGVSGANRTLADIYNQGYGNIAAGYGNIAGAYGGIGNAYGANYGTRAGLETGYGSDLANVYGNVAAGRTQAQRDVAQGNIASNNLVAQQGATDASNLWGLLGAGVKAAGSAFGGGKFA